MSNEYEWLRFVDLDKIATEEQRQKLGIINPQWDFDFDCFPIRKLLLCYFCNKFRTVKAAIRFAIDLTATKETYQCVHRFVYDPIIQEYLVDAGFDCDCPVYPPKASICEHFKLCRNAARLGTIVVMGAIRSRLWRERERGWKDVSRIIGRLIWESRKYYLSEESPTLSKRIKNE